MIFLDSSGSYAIADAEDPKNRRASQGLQAALARREPILTQTILCRSARRSFNEGSDYRQPWHTSREHNFCSPTGLHGASTNGPLSYSISVPAGALASWTA